MWLGRTVREDFEMDFKNELLPEGLLIELQPQKVGGKESLRGAMPVRMTPRS